MALNGNSNISVESDLPLSSDGCSNASIGIDSVALSSDFSSNVTIGIDGVGPRAQRLSNGSSNASVDDNYGLRAPSFEGLRAPSNVNVESSRADENVEGEIVNEVINEEQVPENSGNVHPEFMEIEKSLNDVEEYMNSEIARLNVIINESYDNFCKRVKTKKRAKLNSRYNKEKKNAKAQIEMFEKERNKRRQRRESSNNENDAIKIDSYERALMSAMIDSDRISANELALNNETELASQVQESFKDYCRRTKKKASAKMRRKWEKDNMSAEEQIAKNKKERERRRAQKAAESENERKRKGQEARDMRNINNDNEERRAKQRRLSNKKRRVVAQSENEDEKQYEARLNSQHEIQNRIHENENEEER